MSLGLNTLDDADFYCLHEVSSLLKQLSPFFFGFGDERDLLLKRARQGELSPRKAEEEAVAQGLGRLTRTPDLNADPRTRVAWTLGMALAWIIWRDCRPVRDYWPEYLAEFAEWHLFEPRDRPEVPSWHLKPRQTPDYLDLRRITLVEAQQRFAVRLAPDRAVEEMDFRLGIGDLPQALGVGTNVHGALVRPADVLKIWPADKMPRKNKYQTGPMRNAAKYVKVAFPDGVPPDIARGDILTAVYAVIPKDAPKNEVLKPDTILRAAGYRED